MTAHPHHTKRVVSADYVNVTDCALLLAVSPATVRRMINSGQLPARRVGGQLRIPITALAHLPAAVEGEHADLGQ